MAHSMTVCSTYPTSPRLTAPLGTTNSTYPLLPLRRPHITPRRAIDPHPIAKERLHHSNNRPPCQPVPAPALEIAVSYPCPCCTTPRRGAAVTFSCRRQHRHGSPDAGDKRWVEPRGGFEPGRGGCSSRVSAHDCRGSGGAHLDFCCDGDGAQFVSCGAE